MILVDLTFAELLGFFFTFFLLVYVVVVVFGGIMRIFEDFYGSQLNRVFHYHYHYKDRRK